MRPTTLSRYAICPLVHSSFYKDVVRGLSATQKYLEPKYFYDAQGDKLFQDIMQSPEYYLTKAEEEILQEQSNAILDACATLGPAFDIVELGAGDASKSIYLLQAAMSRGLSSHYYPIDISENVIAYLQQTIPGRIPGMETEGFAGEYFHMLDRLSVHSQRPKLVLFLGATIGNMPPEEANHFCRELHTYLNEGDLLLIGFDLKKDPKMILDAYNDAAGITREFNLNLLRRINRELGGNFDTDKFIHYPVYDPGTGACKSYLISKEKQSVTLNGSHTFSFEKDEPVYMEISQKYNLPELDQLAQKSGFTPVTKFFDSRQRFTDALWKVPSLKTLLRS